MTNEVYVPDVEDYLTEVVLEAITESVAQRDVLRALYDESGSIQSGAVAIREEVEMSSLFAPALAALLNHVDWERIAFRVDDWRHGR